MKQFITTDSVKHRSQEFDVARTKVKMQTLFALEKSDNTDFDVVLLLHARDQLKNDIHLPDHRDRVCSSFNDENTFRSNIIVQDFGQLQGVRQATHEFGHLLMMETRWDMSPQKMGTL